MANLRYGGLRQATMDEVAIEPPITCPKCGSEIPAFATAGEPPTPKVIEDFLKKIEEECPHHGGLKLHPY
jgi:hypothetical protein